MWKENILCKTNWVCTVKTQPIKDFKIIILLFCIVAVGLIYSVNVYQLVYQFTEWNEFGKMPVDPYRILDFIPKTAIWMGYLNPETGEVITCKESIVYLETTDQKTYRCCNLPEKVSCVVSNLPSPDLDQECQQYMIKLFNLPRHLVGSRDFKVFGYCPHSGSPAITAVRITNGGNILWKSVGTLEVDFINIGLKYCIGPWLILISGLIIVTIVKTKKTSYA
jgi:hypothetical protein